MNEEERSLDLALAECEQENRLLRARIDRLEKEAQRTWVGLTDEEIEPAYWGYMEIATQNGFEKTVKALEAKLKEKNHGDK